MDRFAEKLSTAISKGLPGTEVQWQMASSDRLVRNFPRVPRDDSPEAGVLILLYPVCRSVWTVFIQRSNYEGVHGGQISFPGGKREKKDADLTGTALREAAEEIAVESDKINIIGTLTPLFIPVSNIVVTPVVGWTWKQPRFRPDPAEVQFVIESDILSFLDRSAVKTRPWSIAGETLNIRYFDYKGHVIWGATAMILHELLEIIRRDGLSLQV